MTSRLRRNHTGNRRAPRTRVRIPASRRAEACLPELCALVPRRLPSATSPRKHGLEEDTRGVRGRPADRLDMAPRSGFVAGLIASQQGSSSVRGHDVRLNECASRGNRWQSRIVCGLGDVGARGGRILLCTCVCGALGPGVNSCGPGSHGGDGRVWV